MSNFISATEELYPTDKQIDQLNIKSAFNLMLNDQMKVYQAIKKNEKNFIQLINFLISHLSKLPKGRLIYCGAGTSARIAVQDGVELLPTFGWPSNRVDYIIAGGKEALLRSVENSEDNLKQAKHFFLKKKINTDDFLICLAASGNTPFTNEIVNLAIENNVKTLTISNNPNGLITKKADFGVVLDTKQEVVAGSTRLKAGTAQKICLNIISTIVMTNLGYVKNGLMINLVPNNKKLKNRIKDIKIKLKEI